MWVVLIWQRLVERHLYDAMAAQVLPTATVSDERRSHRGEVLSRDLDRVTRFAGMDRLHQGTTHRQDLRDMFWGQAGEIHQGHDDRLGSLLLGGGQRQSQRSRHPLPPSRVVQHIGAFDRSIPSPADHQDAIDSAAAQGSDRLVHPTAPLDFDQSLWLAIATARTTGKNDAENAV